jgi:hypothetical protein
VHQAPVPRPRLHQVGLQQVPTEKVHITLHGGALQGSAASAGCKASRGSGDGDTDAPLLYATDGETKTEAEEEQVPGEVGPPTPHHLPPLARVRQGTPSLRANARASHTTGATNSSAHATNPSNMARGRGQGACQPAGRTAYPLCSRGGHPTQAAPHPERAASSLCHERPPPHAITTTRPKWWTHSRSTR